MALTTFAVSATWTRDMKKGEQDLKTTLRIITADNQAEAVGLFVNEVFEAFENFKLASKPCVIKIGG